MIEKLGVLLQLVCNLVNNEATARSKRVMSLLQQRAFLVDLEDAKWNSRDDVIARADAAPLQFSLQVGRVVIDYVDARIVAELTAQIA